MSEPDAKIETLIDQRHDPIEQEKPDIHLHIAVEKASHEGEHVQPAEHLGRGDTNDAARFDALA